MANLLFPYGGLKTTDKKTFRVHSAAIGMGDPVMMSGTANWVQTSTSGQATIGWVVDDDSYEARTGTVGVAVGDLVNVALRGTVLTLTSGTIVPVGVPVSLTSLGKVTGDSGTTGAALIGISLEAASAANTRFDVMVY